MIKEIFIAWLTICIALVIPLGYDWYFHFAGALEMTLVSLFGIFMALAVMVLLVRLWCNDDDDDDDV